MSFNYTSLSRSNITLRWRPPLNTDGAPISSYIISYSSSFSADLSSYTNVTHSNTTFSYTISNLQINTTYYVALTVVTPGGSTTSAISSISTAPVLCGDGICDAQENCLNCFFDCSDTCGDVKCPKDCSNHGKCVTGICNCEQGFFGVDCSRARGAAQVPTQVNIGASTPEASLQTNSTERKKDIDKVVFNISVNYVREIDENNNEVMQYQLGSFPYIVSKFEGVGRTTNQYTANFSNNAEFIVNITTFTEDTSIVFAGQAINVAAGSVKFSVKISQWPFIKLSNKLQVAFASNALSTNKKQNRPQVIQRTEGNGLRSESLSLDSLTLYTRFFEFAVVDDTIKKVQFLSQDSEIVATVPHFWHFAEFDPDYQVLLAAKNGSNVNGALIGGIIGGVLGLAIIIGAVMYFFQRKHEVEVERVLSYAETAQIEENGTQSETTDKRKSAIPNFESPRLSTGLKGRFGHESIELKENQSEADSYL